MLVMVMMVLFNFVCGLSHLVVVGESKGYDFQLWYFNHFHLILKYCVRQNTTKSSGVFKT